MLPDSSSRKDKDSGVDVETLETFSQGIPRGQAHRGSSL